MKPHYFTKSNITSDLLINRKLKKSKCFDNKVIITNGFNGSGKTLIAPLVSSIENVELMTFAYELEWASSFLYSNQLSQNAYREYVKMFVDHSIYNQAMGRNVNFRPSDLSSLFKNRKKFTYLSRIFSKGDNAIPEKIVKNKPVLSLTTCHLLPFIKNLFDSLEDRLIFIETVRDPIYMFNQLLILYETVIDDDFMKIKDFTLRVDTNGVTGSYLDYYSDEKIFNEIKNSDSKSIVVSYIERIFKFYFNFSLMDNYQNQFILIPFEPFVLSPEKYINNILNSIGLDWSKSLKKEMKKQKVPRKLISAGKNLAIYRRFDGNTGANNFMTLDEEKYNKRLETRNLINNNNLYSRLELLSDEYYKWINKL